MARRVLIIDDDMGIRESLQALLEDEGFLVSAVESGEKALSVCLRETFDAALLDIWMPGMDGIATVEQLQKICPQLMILMMSGHGTIETAVKATKLGAFDFLEKPLSIDRVLLGLQRAFAARSLVEENTALRKEQERSNAILGISPAIEQIRNLIKKAAPTTMSVLITGENGTGKEVVARQIHLQSQRFHKPLLSLNCAAIPDELLEAELFGYERGAFTGANQLKKGRFEQADGGTLFLDEIGDMSLKTQAKVLRVLQEQKFERLGGRETLECDVRVIAATNKNLHKMIQEQNFREDLFYRLNAFPIHVPALRDRKIDIPLLAETFLNRFIDLYQRIGLSFSKEAIATLIRYPWPGNVRELRHFCERLVVLHSAEDIGLKHEITADTIIGLFRDGNLLIIENIESASPETFDANTSAVTLRDARIQFEKDFINQALKQNGNNITKAAQALGIERSNLHKKLKAYSIEVKE